MWWYVSALFVRVCVNLRTQFVFLLFKQYVQMLQRLPYPLVSFKYLPTFRALYSRHKMSHASKSELRVPCLCAQTSFCTSGILILLYSTGTINWSCLSMLWSYRTLLLPRNVLKSVTLQGAWHVYGRRQACSICVWCCGTCKQARFSQALEEQVWRKDEN